MLKFVGYLQEYENKRNVFNGIVVNNNKWQTNVTSQMLKIEKNYSENDSKINAIERTKKTSNSITNKTLKIKKKSFYFNLRVN